MRDSQRRSNGNFCSTGSRRVRRLTRLPVDLADKGDSRRDVSTPTAHDNSFIDDSLIDPSLLSERPHRQETACGTASDHEVLNRSQYSAFHNDSKVATLSSNVSHALDNLWKFSPRELSTAKALDLEKSPKTLNPEAYEWINGFKRSRVMAKRKMPQQMEAKAKAKAYVPLIPSSHSKYELGSLPNTALVSPKNELQKSPGKLKRKVMEEGETQAKLYRGWSQIRAPENQPSSAEGTTVCTGLAGCKSFDPGQYQNHPFACGCDHISHLFSPQTITSSIGSSGCTSCGPNIHQRCPHGCRCNKPSPPVASSITSRRAGNKVSPNPNTRFDFEEEYKKPRLSKGNAPYGLEDWNTVVFRKESPPPRSAPVGKALMSRIRALMPMDSAPTLIVKAPKSGMIGAPHSVGSLPKKVMAARAVNGSRVPTAAMGSRAPTAVMGSVHLHTFSQPRISASSVVRTSTNHEEDTEKGCSARGF